VVAVAATVTVTDDKDPNPTVDQPLALGEHDTLSEEEWRFKHMLEHDRRHARPSGCASTCASARNHSAIRKKSSYQSPMKGSINPGFSR
jgi:hypothetical protein